MMEEQENNLDVNNPPTEIPPRGIAMGAETEEKNSRNSGSPSIEVPATPAFPRGIEMGKQNITVISQTENFPIPEKEKIIIEEQDIIDNLPTTDFTQIQRKPYYEFQTPKHTKPSPDIDSLGFELVKPSDEDVKLVMNYDFPPNHSISKIFWIHLPALTQYVFEGEKHLLANREGKSAFKQGWPEENSILEDSQARKHVYLSFLEQTSSYPDLPVHQIVGWHGLSNEGAIESILQSGFAVLGSRDAGYFGKGIYFTTSLKYSHQYTDEKSPASFTILAEVSTYSPFPVIAPDKPMLEGKNNYQNYDSHYTLVDPAREYNPAFPRNDDNTCFPNELVVFNGAQVIARMLVVWVPNFSGVSPLSNTQSRQVQAIQYFQEGLVLQEQGKIKDAIEKFKLAGEGGYTPAWVVIGELKFEKDPIKAIQYYATHEKHPYIAYKIALYCKDNKNIEDYVIYLGISAELGHIQAGYELAIWHLENKTSAEIDINIKHYLEKAETASLKSEMPDLKHATYYLCLYYVQCKNILNAERYYKKCEKMYNKNDDKASILLQKIKEILDNAKKDAELEDLCKQLADLRKQLAASNKTIQAIGLEAHLVKNDIESYKTEINFLNEENTIQKCIIEDQQKEIKTLKSQLEKSQSTFASKSPSSLKPGFQLGLFGYGSVTKREIFLEIYDQLKRITGINQWVYISNLDRAILRISVLSETQVGDIISHFLIKGFSSITLEDIYEEYTGVGTPLDSKPVVKALVIMRPRLDWLEKIPAMPAVLEQAKIEQSYAPLNK